MSYPAATRKFIAHVREECKQHGIRLRLSRAKALDAGDCLGYFDEGSKTLAVACGDRGWIEILVHEYCHMLQWIKNTKIWRESCEYWYWDWVAGKAERPKQVTNRANRAQLSVELDCEIRAVRMIKEWKLPIDIVEYTKAANSYILFYTFIRMNGVWFNKNPYTIPEIKAMMPRKFMPRRWYDKLPPSFAHLVFRHCLSPAKQRLAWTRLVKVA